MEVMFEFNGMRFYKKAGDVFFDTIDVCRKLNFTTVLETGDEVIKWGELKKVFIDSSVMEFFDDKPPKYIHVRDLNKVCVRIKSKEAIALVDLISDNIKNIMNDILVVHNKKQQISEVEKALSTLKKNYNTNLSKEVDNEKLNRGIIKDEENKFYYTITNISTQYCVQPVHLNNFLCALKIQNRIGDKINIDEAYKDCGYHAYRHVKLEEENYFYRMYWTEKGKKFIEDILTENGFIKKANSSYN